MLGLAAQDHPADPGAATVARLDDLVDALLANSTEAIVLVDDHGTIQFVTRGVAELLGHDRIAAVGSSIFDFVHPDDVARSADLFVQRLEYPGKDPGVDLRVRHSSGEWIELTSTISLLPAYAAAAITLRPRRGWGRERGLQRRIAAVEYTNQVGADLMSAADTDGVIECIRNALPTIGLLTGAGIVAVYLERRRSELLQLLGGWRSPGADQKTSIEIVHDEGAVRTMLDEHLVVDQLSPTAHPELYRLAKPLGITGLLSTPFTTGNQRGVIVVGRIRDGVSWWDSDSELVRGVANLFGRALRSAWSEQLLSLTYQQGPVAFSIRTLDGRLVDCNQRYLDLFGLDRSTAMIGRLDELVSSHSRAEIRRRLTEVADGGEPVEQDFEAIRGDGSIIWIRGHSVALQVPGSPEQYVLTALHDATESRHQRKQLEHAATHDSLTGLANRTGLCEAIDRAALHFGQMPTLMMVDLDRFKLVNDGFGHVVGDAVLQAVADRLQQHVRNGDVVARLGGDEFAIVVPGANRDQSLMIAARIRSSLLDPIITNGRVIHQTISLGIALGSECDDLPALLVRADRALYAAKGQGRNQHVLFDESMRDQVLEQITIERDLRHAITSDQLEVYFQPEFSVPDRRIIGAEALVRWHHPERGLVPAQMFMAVAEESGLIDQIGRFAIRSAARRFVALSKGHDELVLSVNASAREFNRSEFPELVLSALDDAGLAASRVRLELTETTFMDAGAAALDAMHRLHDTGVQFAIDNFGTGSSSLAYLKRFPIDVIKIDRGFIRDITDNADSRAIVHSILGLCDSLSLHAVAEGVELETQLATLHDLGCERAQGFLVAPALPADELATLIAG